MGSRLHNSDSASTSTRLPISAPSLGNDGDYLVNEVMKNEVLKKRMSAGQLASISLVNRKVQTVTSSLFTEAAWVLFKDYFTSRSLSDGSSQPSLYENVGAFLDSRLGGHVNSEKLLHKLNTALNELAEGKGQTGILYNQVSKLFIEFIRYHGMEDYTLEELHNYLKPLLEEAQHSGIKIEKFLEVIKHCVYRVPEEIRDRDGNITINFRREIDILRYRELIEQPEFQFISENRPMQLWLLKMTDNGWQTLSSASDSLKADKEFVLEFIAKDPEAINLASMALKADSEVLFEAVRRDPCFWAKLEMTLPELTRELQDNRELDLKHLRQNNSELYLVTRERFAEIMGGLADTMLDTLVEVIERLRMDKEAMLAAIRLGGGSSWPYACDELQNNEDFILAAVKQNSEVLRSPTMKEKIRSKEFALKIVRENGLALGALSDELKQDEDVILAAIKQDYRVLQFVYEGFKTNKDMILKAVQQNGLALEYAGEFKADREVVFAAVQQNGLALKSAADEFKADREMVFAAVQQNGLALEFSKRSSWDWDLIYAALRQNGLALEFVPTVLPPIVLAAIRQNPLAWKFVDPELKKDTDFIRDLLRINPEYFRYVYEKEDPEALASADFDIKFEKNFPRLWAICNLAYHMTSPLSRS